MTKNSDKGSKLHAPIPESLPNDSSLIDQRSRAEESAKTDPDHFVKSDPSKASEPPPEAKPFTPPEAKAFRCETCDSLFVPVGNQIVCDACLAKLQANRVSVRAGYVKCKVVGDGGIVANGFVGDSVRTNHAPGDVAEFSKADVDSLPGRFEPVT